MTHAPNIWRKCCAVCNKYANVFTAICLDSLAHLLRLSKLEVSTRKWTTPSRRGLVRNYLQMRFARVQHYKNGKFLTNDGASFKIYRSKKSTHLKLWEVRSQFPSLYVCNIMWVAYQANFKWFMRKSDHFGVGAHWSEIGKYSSSMTIWSV